MICPIATDGPPVSGRAVGGPAATVCRTRRSAGSCASACRCWTRTAQPRCTSGRHRTVARRRRSDTAPERQSPARTGSSAVPPGRSPGIDWGQPERLDGRSESEPCGDARAAPRPRACRPSPFGRAPALPVRPHTILARAQTRSGRAPSGHSAAASCAGVQPNTPRGGIRTGVRGSPATRCGWSRGQRSVDQASGCARSGLIIARSIPDASMGDHRAGRAPETGSRAVVTARIRRSARPPPCPARGPRDRPGCGWPDRAGWRRRPRGTPRRS